MLEDFQIIGARLVLEDEVVEDGTLVVIDGRIAYAGPSRFAEGASFGWWTNQPVDLADLPVVDGRGMWLFPGFIDVHIHGGGGRDVMEATVEALEHIAQTHGRHGTTGFLATTVTAPYDQIRDAARAVRQAIDAARQHGWTGARLLGLHLEGPYLNPERAGAQDPRWMRPADEGELRELLEILGDDFCLATLAPEISGGMEALRLLDAAGVVVSVGHSDATYDRAIAAFHAGARHVTHTFNGMRGFQHREPGLAGAAMLHPGALCEVIADGIHVHPEAIRLLCRIKGVDGVCLITDAIEAADMTEGEYRLGGLQVRVEDGACRLPDGTLAGSILTMDRAVGYVIEQVGLSPVEAARMAALNPARQLRLADQKGSLRPGKDADLALLDASFRAVRTWVEGRIISQD